MKSKIVRVLRPWLAVCAGVLLAQGAARAAATIAPPATAAASTAVASPPAKSVATTAQGGQRNKMKACNAEAREKDLHKAERRAFMKQCLSKGSAA